MRTIISILFLLLGGAAVLGQAASISPTDLKPLEGVEWKGELTYLDYGSNKKTSIRSHLRIIAAGGNGRAWQFEYLYPDEPKANAKSEVELSSDGRIFNGQTITERSKLPDGALRIVAIKDGMDNDKKATFRYIYLISSSKFSITKEVRPEGKETFFERNTYSWSR